jgi:hypothetical protein
VVSLFEEHLALHEPGTGGDLRQGGGVAHRFGVKQGLGLNSGLPAVALDVAGIAWEAAERADTRCWSLLPDRIEVLRLASAMLGHSGFTCVGATPSWLLMMTRPHCFYLSWRPDRLILKSRKPVM